MANKALTEFKRELTDFIVNSAMTAIERAEEAASNHQYMDAKIMLGMFYEAACFYEEFIEDSPEGETIKSDFDELHERCWTLNEALNDLFD